MPTCSPWPHTCSEYPSLPYCFQEYEQPDSSCMPEYLTLESEPCHSQFMKGYSIHVFNTTFRMFPDFFSQSVSPRPRKKVGNDFSLLQNTILDDNYTEAWTKQSVNRRRMFMHSRVESKLTKTLYCEMSATKHSGEMKKVGNATLPA